MFWDIDSDTSSDTFEDMDAAYKDLQDNIFTLCDDQLLQLIATKAKRRRSVKKNLPELLYNATLTSIYSGESLLGPPIEFIKWLWKVALSGCSVGLILHQGAQRTLMAFANFRKECLFKNLLSPRSFHNELKNVFGFQASKNPCGSTKTRIGNEKDYIYPDVGRSLDMSAFENFLKLWIHAIRSDIVSWECKGQLDGLSAILSTVIRIGLDAQFHVTQKDIMCRRDIFDHLQQFMEIIIDKIENLSPSEQILDSIVESIVESLRDLKCGPPSSEDADDENGVLPLALATRNIPITKMYDNALLHLGCVQFKTRFAKHAFFSCNSCDAQSWKEVHSKFESKLGLEIAKNVEAETKLRSAWCAFIDGAVAFYEVYRLSGFWEDDCPRCYASIDIADSLMRASRMLLLNMHESLGEVDDVKTYAACKTMFDYGEHYCNETKKSISAVFTHPHLRRAKEYLTTLSIYFSRLKEDADTRTGVVKVSSKQRKMSSFFRPIAAMAQ